MNWSIDDLRAVDEVAELRLPEHERLGRRGRVAVLEAEAAVLRERRVVDLEGRRRAVEVLDRRERARRSSRRGARAWRCENVPRSVSWPGQPDRDAVDEQAARRRAPPPGPSRCRPRRALAAAARAASRASDGRRSRPARAGAPRSARAGAPPGRHVVTPVAPPRGISSSLRLRRDRLRRRSRLSALVRLAHRRSRRACEEPSRLRLRDDARGDELLARRARAPDGWLAICSTISGCVYAASSCSLWPKRR